MRTLETLIDEAADMCGSDRQLCERTGLHPSELSDMRAGRKTISPERVGLLADVLELDGEEARRLAVLAIVQAAKPARKEALRRAFFVSLAGGVALLCGGVATNNSYAKTIVNKSLIDVLYIVRSLLNAFSGMARYARRSAGLRLEPLSTGSQPLRAAAAP